MIRIMPYVAMLMYVFSSDLMACSIFFSSPTSGKVCWEGMDGFEPGRNGYSVVEENDPKKIRWAKGTSDKVDFVYNDSWGKCLAIKVPSNCAAKFNANGFLEDRCLAGGKSQVINTCDTVGSYPDQGLVNLPGAFEDMRGMLPENIVAARWVAEAQIMKARQSDGALYFSPSEPLDRLNAIRHIYQWAGSTMNSQGRAVWTIPFTDVSPNEDAVHWAVGTGVTNGKTPTLFGATEIVSRAQFVTFLYRWVTGDLGGTRAWKDRAIPFSDVPDNVYYRAAVAWAYVNRITLGTGRSTFGPNNTITRLQAALMIYRATGINDSVIRTKTPYQPTHWCCE